MVVADLFIMLVIARTRSADWPKPIVTVTVNERQKSTKKKATTERKRSIDGGKRTPREENRRSWIGENMVKIETGQAMRANEVRKVKETKMWNAETSDVMTWEIVIVGHITARK